MAVDTAHARGIDMPMLRRESADPS